jgi:RNA polymerase sigma-70 factor (ECF subfamily)
VLVPPDSDAALVRRARAGDRTAFGDLYERHRRFVSGIVANYKLYDVQEDLIHDAFIKAMQGLPDAKPETEDNFKNWLARIAVNCCLDHVRKLSTKNEKSGGLPTEWDDDGLLSQAVTTRGVSDPAPTPEDHLLQAERLRLVNELLDTLPPDDAMAVRLQANGEDLRSISRRLMVPYGTIKPRMFRTRATLARAIVSDAERYGPLDAERADRSMKAKLSVYHPKRRAIGAPLSEGESP